MSAELNSPRDPLTDLNRRLRSATGHEQFLAALDEIVVYLTAQREIAATLEKLGIYDAAIRRAA